MPNDAKKLFERSGLQDSLELVYEHWDAFLLALRFISHKRFKNAANQKQKSKKSAKPKKSKDAKNEIENVTDGNEDNASKKENAETEGEEKEKTKKFVPKPAATKMRHGRTMEDMSLELISNGNPHNCLKLETR